MVKIAQGAVRLAYLWDDISTLKDGFKLILGFEKVMDKIPDAANKVRLISKEDSLSLITHWSHQDIGLFR